jgi:beta-1,4-mannosyl-glycoprotein beta-1,4-N-acetylglucosaminyltransferase
MPNDMVLLSDVDEIPRAASIRAAVEANHTNPTVHCFELMFFKYYLNLLHREPWSRNGPRLTKRRHLRSMQGLREVHPPIPNPFRSSLRWMRASIAIGRPVRRVVHANSGWHFSYIGGVERVAQRLRSGAHLIGERRHDPEARMITEAVKRVAAAKSDKSLRRVMVDTSFPAFLFQNQEKFYHLLAPVDSGNGE